MFLKLAPISLQIGLVLWGYQPARGEGALPSGLVWKEVGG